MLQVLQTLCHLLTSSDLVKAVSLIKHSSPQQSVLGQPHHPQTWWMMHNEIGVNAASCSGADGRLRQNYTVSAVQFGGFIEIILPMLQSSRMRWCLDRSSL